MGCNRCNWLQFYTPFKSLEIKLEGGVWKRWYIFNGIIFAEGYFTSLSPRFLFGQQSRGLPGTLLSLCLCTGWPDFCCSFHCAFLTHIWYEHIAPCSVVRSCTNICAFLVTRVFSAFKRAVGDFTVWHDQMAFTYPIFSGWQTFVFLQSKTVKNR